MIVTFDAKKLVSELNNITQYSIGFLEGAEAAKPVLMDNLGKTVVDLLKNFIDTNARTNPEILHHVYEWYETGSPQARLFDIDYRVTGTNGLSFNYTFSQSRSFSKNSKEVFYDKARIMEEGIPVTIRPRGNGVLSFNSDGEQVFTKKPIVVSNPGGQNVQGGFKRTLDLFFDSYFTQSFLISSGIASHFKNVSSYKNNFRSGSKQGKPLGFKLGYEWVAKGGKIE